MAVLVRTCCCGCGLRIGVFLIAIWSVISGGFGIYSGFHNSSVPKSAREEVREDSELQLLPPVPLKYYEVITNLRKVDAVFKIIVLLTSILLLVACCLKNRFLVLPYLAWYVIVLGYNLGVWIFYIIVLKWAAVSAIVIVYGMSCVPSIYFLIVVYSFHEALREDPSGVSAGYGPPGQAASGAPPAVVPYKPFV
ncbi:uncharacterized protein [Montipora capricornis]|uniref:uncharacterized protein isoform X1 n=1 Tax=Montipora capricornis TaxID=246305 RepID=UPI0035F19610